MPCCDQLIHHDRRHRPVNTEQKAKMKDISITIRYEGNKQSVPTRDDIILDDLLSQLAEQGRIPSGQNWIVTKAGGDTALPLDRSLADNNISDGDILDLALPSKAGA